MTSVLQNLPPVLVLFFIKSDYNKSVFSSGRYWICGDHSTVPQNFHRRSRIKAQATKTCCRAHANATLGERGRCPGFFHTPNILVKCFPQLNQARTGEISAAAQNRRPHKCRSLRRRQMLIRLLRITHFLIDPSAESEWMRLRDCLAPRLVVGGGTANFDLYIEPWPTEQGSEVRAEPFWN